MQLMLRQPNDAGLCSVDLNGHWHFERRLLTADLERDDVTGRPALQPLQFDPAIVGHREFSIGSVARPMVKGRAELRKALPPAHPGAPDPIDEAARRYVEVIFEPIPQPREGRAGT